MNRNDNRLVREAINAARNLIEVEEPRARNSLKVVAGNSKPVNKRGQAREENVIKVIRPTTAPQKRAPSPKGLDARGKTFNQAKGASFGNIKKKTKQTL